MTRNSWAISDTHFFHANTFLKFKKEDGTPLRPFSSVEEMNEIMVQNCCKVMRDGDYLYHLGDVTVEYGENFGALMSRIPGKKRLYLGNHDKIIGTNLLKHFKKAGIWRIFTSRDDPSFLDQEFTFSHFPLHPSTFRHKTKVNVHGHTHGKIVKDEAGKPDPRYMNICVEQTNFGPINFDTILAEIRRRGV